MKRPNSIIYKEIALVKNNVKISLRTKQLLGVFWAIESVLFIVIIQRVFIQSWLTAGIILAFMVLISPVYFLAKQGKNETGSKLILLLLTFLLLGFIWTYGGLRDEVLMVFPAIIMVSVLLSNYRFAFLIYLLVSVNIFSIGYFNDIGLIYNDPQESDLVAASLIIIILSFISYTAWLLASKMNRTTLELQKNKEELEQRVLNRTKALEESLHNLTETQEQLVQTEKMAALGRLVAGVAHEINTPIGIAITASSYLEDATDVLSDLYDKNTISKQTLIQHIESTTNSSKLIQSNLKRAAELIQGFKEVAVDQSSEDIREFDLKEYLMDILSSLQPQLKRKNCKFELSCPDKLLVKTLPGSLAQIITNLVMNTIIHAYENIDNAKIYISIEKRNNRIFLLFKDVGCGISPKNLDNIFEPFFTTKRGQGGSGLGMHIVYNLVTQSLLGNIQCESTLGEGTRFNIEFPCQLQT